MDFVSYIRNQRQKLNRHDYVKHVWKELNNGEVEEPRPDIIDDFNNHLPILFQQFWEIAVEKLKESPNFEEIDEDLRIYLLVLIHQCITQSHELVSFKCVVCACEVYFHLLGSPQCEEFFNSKLYIASLTTLQSFVNVTSSENLSSGLIVLLRHFVVKSKLNVSDLEVTLATLVHIIFAKTIEPCQSFEISENYKPLSHEALNTLKVLLEEEKVQNRQFLIITYLFNGLRKPLTMHLTPRQFNVIQTNFRNLIKSLHLKFKEDHYNTFLNAFIHVWRFPGFTYFTEAVYIMNSLKERYYRRLIEILNGMLSSKSSNRNLFKFTTAVVCIPPKHLPIEKINVTNEVLLRSILLNCCSNKTEISNAAIESFAEILMSPDFEKEFVKGPVKNVLNCKIDENLSVPILLKGLQSLMSKKWGTKSKNKHLFIIVISIMLFSEDDHPESYREVLDFLTEQCSPFDLKPTIGLMTEAYLKLINKNYKFSALQIVKIMFRMAVHTQATSSEFVKHLYASMTHPLKSEFFIEPIISDNYNFQEFFQKCHTLGLIRTEHVSRLIGDLSQTSESNLKLLCAIVHLTDYKELAIFGEYINDNFMTICNSPNLCYYLYIYNGICKNYSSLRSHQNLRSNRMMLQFLKYHLLRQTLRWSCVPNAFATLNTLHEFTNLEQDFQEFKENYDKLVTSTLQTKGSLLPLLYYSQLILFGKITPREEIMKEISDFLTLCSDQFHSRSPDLNSKLWIGCLTLYTNICVIRNDLVEIGLNYLQDALNSSIIVVKFTAINLTFDLCNMVTHNFEDVIRYMFRQLVYGDNIFKKTCLVKLDRLIRDDYLKMDLEQFLVFVAILGSRNVELRDYFHRLLDESFLSSNGVLVTRHFIPLIVHLNGFKEHPLYKLNSASYELIQIVSRNVGERRKIYNCLFDALSLKQRFNVIFFLSTNVFEKVFKGHLRVDEGLFNVLKDCIYIFKLATNACEDEPGENFYKKVGNLVTKHLIQRSEVPESVLHKEYHKEVIQGTESLLRLLFFKNSGVLQSVICVTLFDAIIHWTNFFMADLTHIIHVERAKEVQNLYIKFDRFYKKNSETLKFSGECNEENAISIDVIPSCSRSLFNSGAQQLIELD